MKANKTIIRHAAPNHRRRKDKKVKSNIDSATHNQTLKNNWQTVLKKKIQQSAAYRRPTSPTDISTG
jgi:hypothetical protein